MTYPLSSKARAARIRSKKVYSATFDLVTDNSGILNSIGEPVPQDFIDKMHDDLENEITGSQKFPDPLTP